MSPSELRQIVAELYRKTVDQSEAYAEAFRTEMDAFWHAIDFYFTPDAQGVFPVFDQQAQNSMMGHLSRLMDDGFMLPYAVNERLSDIGLLFASVDASKGKPLEDTVNALEILTYRTETEPGRAGAAMSSRGMIRATVGDNSTINGYFTPDEQVSPEFGQQVH